MKFFVRDGKGSNKQKALLIMISIMALVVQPLYGLLASYVANATPNTSYNSVGLSGWEVDRTAPSGGYEATTFDGRPSLRLGVTPPSNASSTFYQFEGVKKSIPLSQTISADLYIDSTWPDNVRAGLWGKGQNSVGELSAYPIVEYNTASANNWRIFDSVGVGEWRDVTVSSAVTGWNTIELAINKTDSTKTEIYVNGVYIGQSVGDVTTALDTIYLNNYSQGSTAYSVYWSAIKVGQYNPDIPSNLRFTKNGSNVASGASVNASFLNGNLTLNFDKIATADQYITRVQYPDGSYSGNIWNSYYQTWIINGGSVLTNAGFGQHGDGVYTFQVKARNTASQQWSDWSESVNLVYDTTKPSVVRVAPTSTIFNKNTKITLKGTDNIGLSQITASLRSDDGTLFKNVSAINLGGVTEYTYDIDLSGLADGSYNLKFNATDTTGNTNAGNGGTQTFSFTIDSELPTVVIHGLSDGDAVNGTVPLRITATDDNLVQYSYRIRKVNPTDNSNTPDPAVVDKAPTSTSGVVDAEVFSWDTLAKWGDGKYYVYVSARDASGNRAEERIYVTVDNTNPVITTNIVENKHYRGALQVDQYVGEANPKAFQFYLYAADGSIAKIDGVNVGAYVYMPTSDTLSKTIDTTKLADGKYYLLFSARDMADNTASLKVWLTIDNTAPVITVKDDYKGDLVSKHFRQVSFKLYDNTMADKYGLNGHVVDFTNNQWSDANYQNIKGYLVQGENTITLYDVAGNSTQYVFTYDTVSPAATITSPAADGQVLKGAITITGEVDPSEASVKSHWFEITNPDDSLSYAYNMSTSSLSYSFTLDTSKGDGVYKIRYVATDKAGNRSDDPNNSNPTIRTLIVDNTVPNVEILNMDAVNPSSFDIKATDAIGLKRIDYSLWKNNNTTQLGVWGADISGTEFNDNGISQYTSNVDWLKKYFTDLADGEYTLRATAGDLAGNSKNAENFNFVVDRTAPKVTVDPIVSSTNTTPVITGAVDEPGLNVTILIDGKEEATVTSDEDGKWSWTPTTPFQVGGPYTVVAVATDAAGNTSSSDTSTDQPYWTQFTVSAPTVAPDPDTSDTTGAGDDEIARGTSAPLAVQNPTITNLNAGDDGNATTDTTPATDEATDTDVLAATTTDGEKEDGQVLAAQDTKGNWSVVNLVLAVVTIILSLGALLGLARKKDGTAARIMTLIPVAIAVTAFLMIENWTASMIWLNWWTVLYAVVLAVQVAIVSGLKNSAE